MPADGPEIGADETPLSISVGLSVAVASSNEPPDGQLAAAGHRSSQQLRRVEPPASTMRRGARYPRDDVGRRRDRGDGIGELGDDRGGTAVLEGTDQLCCLTSVRGRGHHLVESGNRGCMHNERESRNGVCQPGE